MAVSGIGSSYDNYGLYSGYHKVRQELQDTQVSQVSQVNQSAPGDRSNENPDGIVEESQKSLESENKAPKNADLNHLFFDFKKNNEYNLVGATSKIEDLDVDKAITDMQKDSVLDQYKFFVKTALTTDEDGSVRQVIRKN